MENFRSPKFVERYEYISFDLQTPIQMPANTAFQKKTGYRFIIDNSNESSPLDWYNGFIEMDFAVQKTADGTGFAGGDHVTIVNSAYSFISLLKADFNGISVNDSPNINHAINVKYLLDFTDTYTNKIGPSAFYFLDTNTGTAEDRSNQALYNAGFGQRKIKIQGAVTNNVVLALNRYGFFNSFENKICPNGKVSIDITLENDVTIMYQAAGDPGRYVVSKMKLWIPKLKFNGYGEQLYVSNYLKPHKWTYLKERVESSNSSQQTQGDFKITSAIRKPRHVLIWALNRDRGGGGAGRAIALPLFCLG